MSHNIDYVDIARARVQKRTVQKICDDYVDKNSPYGGPLGHDIEFFNEIQPDYISAQRFLDTKWHDAKRDYYSCAVKYRCNDGIFWLALIEYYT